jgi:hypothetical protein
MKWFDRILYFLFFPLVALGAIVSPLTNDVRIFYGVEYLDWKYLSNFPSNILGFWEIKPVGNHLCNYALVVVTNFFIPFQDHLSQEIFIKCIAVAIAIFACWTFSKNVLKIKYGFLLCFVAMFCSLNLNTLQAEWWATIFAMIACALFMEANSNWSYLAGALLIPTLLVKGTSGALIISCICIVVMFNYSPKVNILKDLPESTKSFYSNFIDQLRLENFYKGFAGFITMGIAFFVASFTIWPTMISDIFLAPILSHVGEYNWFGMIYVTAVAIVISFSIYIPAVGISAVYGGSWFKEHLRDPRAPWFLAMWIAPLCVVFLQSESFAYQYFIFIIPAIISFVLYEKETPLIKPGKKLKRENLIAATIVILFVLWCFLYSPIGKYGSEERAMNSYFNNESAKIESQFKISDQKSVLYLDTGSGPYYFGVNSSCRYVAPLIIQRANPNRTQILSLPQNRDAYNCIMSYTGRYIIADGKLGANDSWLGNDTYEKQNINVKIANEYTDVSSGGWEIYRRN